MKLNKLFLFLLTLTVCTYNITSLSTSNKHKNLKEDLATEEIQTPQPQAQAQPTQAQEDQAQAPTGFEAKWQQLFKTGAVRPASICKAELDKKDKTKKPEAEDQSKQSFLPKQKPNNKYNKPGYDDSAYMWDYLDSLLQPVLSSKLEQLFNEAKNTQPDPSTKNPYAITDVLNYYYVNGGQAKMGFDPTKDVDPTSLRFGAPSRVDFGKTSAPLSTEVRGTRLIAEFAAADCGFQPSDRTAKLLAHDRKGGLVFGYAALPDEPAEYPLLSALGSVKAAAIEKGARELMVEVENFGLAKSVATQVNLKLGPQDREPFTAPLPALAPYESASVTFHVPAELAPVESTPQVEILIEGAEPQPLKVTLSKLP